jgi:hypothetical protein
MASKSSKLAVVLLGTICAVGSTACRGNGKGRSSASAWVDNPTQGQHKGGLYEFPELQVQFEVPETLYVYKDCGEAAHSPDGSTKWIPVITCRSGGSSEYTFGEESEEEDPFAEEEMEDASGAEAIDLTFYVTHKTRPLDERSVTWFENKYKQAGLGVFELSYQSDYQKKEGIYAKLHVLDGDGGSPVREIVQFMFPRNDVVFIARMEYPFGETRSVEKDWQYILWNFHWLGTKTNAVPAEEEEEEEESEEEDL